MSSYPEELPPHLASLVPAQWAVWRWFVLRGAGFPAELMGRLAQTRCAMAADKFLLAENAVEGQFQAAIQSLNQMLDRFTFEGKDRHDKTFVAVLNARRRLAARKVPENQELAEEFAAMFYSIKLAMTERASLRLEFDKIFAASLESQSEVLRSFAGDSRFREAILWQNRQAFETAVEPASQMRSETVRNQRQRNHEELIANYAQRYCVKNDTIGFFGPVAWGRIEQGGKKFELDHGRQLVKSRHTYFESWAIDKVAARLSQMEGMDWWIPPRRMPDIFIDKGVLFRPGTPPASLADLEQALLPLCDGRNIPEEILHLLQQNPQFQSTGKTDVSNLLKAKAKEGIIVWRFLASVEVNSELDLRRQLLRIGDPELRNAALGQLEKLEAARKDVASVAGNPGLLNDALRKVELVFEQITNTSAQRNPGTTYGGRTILYEDCQRDASLRITPDLLAPIVPALSLLLKSLRWLMQSTALKFHHLFRQTYGELRQSGNSSRVRLLDWWLHTEPKLINAPSLSEVDQLFRQKWAEILPIEQHGPTIRFSSNELKEKVEALFPELGPGYYPVRYFCPDLMLAATDQEAIQRGGLLYVLGEVHSGKNTLCHAALVEQHPNRQDLIDATEWDLSATCFKILNTQESGTTTVRTSEGVLRPKDFLVATTSDATAPWGHDSHPIGALMLVEQEEELYVVNRSDNRRFHILEAFSDLLFAFVMNKASWIPQLRHAPRVSVDQLVIHRETWRFRRDELAFALEKDESCRFLGARRWMRSKGIPQKTFVKSALEVKPFYMDMDSPVLVEILCRAIRRMDSSEEGGPAELVFSEMLPTSEQLWLKDSAGASHTSELRFAIVDLKARSSS